jgi:formamidopyrimidine-DNA glycosylase
MPELPEVETVVRGLRAAVIGDVIESVWIGSRHQPLKSPAAEIATALEGARITAVHRMGKHIVIQLHRAIGSSAHRLIKSRRGTSADDPIPRSPDPPISDDPIAFIVHLGMTGQLVVARPDQPIPRHTHLIARLASGREVRFTDPRMFGRLAVAREHFQPGGAEPLDVAFEEFAPLFRRRQTPIKSALLNQKLLRGIGNIYADEALFRAGVRPRRRAASLTRAELQRLHRHIRQVLDEAIAAGGSSVSDYVGASGEPGFFQLQHRVYGREGEPCLVCGTPVKRVVIAGRSSHYCPKCQK